MKRVVVSMAAGLLIAAVIAGPVASHETMRMGTAIHRTVAYDPERRGCVASGATWVQEMGASGINRLRFRYNLHYEYDFIESTYAAVFSTGWIYGPPFLDDARSFYTTFHWSVGLGTRVGTATLYKARELAIGERPSFWQPDRKLGRDARGVICNADPSVG